MKVKVLLICLALNGAARADMVCYNQNNISDWKSIKRMLDEDKLLKLARKAYGEPPGCTVFEKGKGETRQLTVTYNFKGGAIYESKNLPPENVIVRVSGKKSLGEETAIHEAVEQQMGGKVPWNHRSDDGDSGPNEDFSYDVPDVNGSVQLMRKGGKIVGIEITMNL